MKFKRLKAFYLRKSSKWVLFLWKSIATGATQPTIKSDHESSEKTNVSQQTQNIAHSRQTLDSQEPIHFRRHSQNKVQWKNKDYGRIDKNMEKCGRVDEQQNEKSSKHHKFDHKHHDHKFNPLTNNVPVI